MRVTAPAPVNGIALIGDDGRPRQLNPISSSGFRYRNQQRTRYLAVEVPPDRTGRATLSVSPRFPRPAASRAQIRMDVQSASACPALGRDDQLPAWPKRHPPWQPAEGVIAGRLTTTTRSSPLGIRTVPKLYSASYVGTRSDFTPSTVEHLICAALSCSTARTAPTRQIRRVRLRAF